MSLFLQGAPVFDEAAFEAAMEEALSGAAGSAAAEGIFGVLIAFFLVYLAVILIIGLGLYIYFSLAFAAIGRKTNYPSPGLAWIPMVGPALIASKAANMHWWPILLLIGGVIPFVGGFANLAFVVFFIIWMWKTFEAVGKPGWWAIFQIIPILNIVWFIFIGIAAWSHSEGSVPAKAIKPVKPVNK